MSIRVIGDLHISDKMDFETDEERVYMINVEEVGLQKTLMVEKDLYNRLPPASELRSRAIDGNPLRVKLEGLLKTKKANWNPVFKDFVVEETIDAQPRKLEAGTSTETTTRPSLKDRMASQGASS